MIEKIFLEELSQDSVNILKKKYTVIDGVEHQIGMPHRCCYANSINGRKQILKNLSNQHYSTVMLIWGDTPTIID